MKKVFSILLAAGFLLAPCAARAQWASLSKQLDELDIRSLAVDPADPKVIFAGSPKYIYRTADGGGLWKKVFTARGANEVRFLCISPLDSKEVYAATARGVWRSLDGGRRWKLFYGGVGKGAKSVFCVAMEKSRPHRLWIGTAEGLVMADARKTDFKKAEGISGGPVYSILIAGDPESSLYFAAADKGIYRSADGGDHWERVLAHADPSLKVEEVPLEQFDIEEMQSVPFISSLVFFQNQEKFFAATTGGIFESAGDGRSWSLLKGQNLPAQKVNFIAKSSQTLYAATDQGVFQWDGNGGSFREIYEGIESTEVRMIFYSLGGDYLLAATDKGIFKLSYPELDLSLLGKENHTLPSAKEILAQFENEPSVEEIQNAAIQYAEVHPSKIESWRKAAARKALLPSLSLDYDLSRDENVDLDRGGTADPDRFIAGPEEENRDWSVGVSWNLGDLIWNNDQTSIDTRSRLMVELRDDVLTQVTHLYYERRRLQVDMVLGATQDLPLRIEKEIRLQELTAGIDALTGGYFSKKLGGIRRN